MRGRQFRWFLAKRQPDKNYDIFRGRFTRAERFTGLALADRVQCRRVIRSQRLLIPSQSQHVHLLRCYMLNLLSQQHSNEASFTQSVIVETLHDITTMVANVSQPYRMCSQMRQSKMPQRVKVFFVRLRYPRRYREVEKMHRQALDLKEKVLGEEHLSTLASMNNLEEVLRHQGTYEEAEQIFEYFGTVE
ncbi:hypothetical protein LTR99_011008 [Exophiala xenobiotica]|uniref:Uncharacterized protein n=1 Tax=Vermiconidia calcicola TaxID=1690605 RepID=A0AAV9PQY2_9PEZI|nr:hypothetical protein LTR72_011972 [Exophiala xenobiotica]KAK5527712.1 hypothetical protein LTR25_010955 [Vermiconidia calcicola]KAK5530190.1 hypothetical protein LTR23_010477 [Chaetothyriales sp. CCFEE 6169]KAK5283923.1 hypothetical protein LTR14_011805 [Exophiala xenobiotica]KAK5290649.1 hypothetical protein LTR99_011008 [Exophiala xenobiotica]